MRTLFALGTDANIRYYETDDENSDFVRQIYAVTYRDEAKQPTTFFIRLLMQRFVDPGSGRVGWTMFSVEGGVRPTGW